jgi:hypothetical protein
MWRGTTSATRSRSAPPTSQIIRGNLGRLAPRRPPGAASQTGRDAFLGKDEYVCIETPDGGRDRGGPSRSRASGCPLTSRCPATPERVRGRPGDRADRGSHRPPHPSPGADVPPRARPVSWTARHDPRDCPRHRPTPPRRDPPSSRGRDVIDTLGHRLREVVLPVLRQPQTVIIADAIDSFLRRRRTLRRQASDIGTPSKLPSRPRPHPHPIAVAPRDSSTARAVGLPITL